MKNYEMIFSQMSLEEKIGQMFMIGFKEQNLPDDIKSFLNEKNIGFVDIFARNIASVEQATELMNQIHQQGKIAPMIFTDQEGGVVCQFAELTSTFSSPMGLAATANTSLIELAAEKMAEDLNLIGLDGFIAPTIDVNHEPNNPIIGIRSFSDDVQTVINSGKAFISGVTKTGLATIPKHFPGHGGSLLDSHLVLPTLDYCEEYFEACDLLPFKEISKTADFIMTAHIAIPYMDPTSLPATFSKYFLTDVLRNKYGFKGVIVTDCLEMGVIKNNYSAEEIVDNTINAGADVMLLSHSLDLQQELYNILLEKVKSGKIPEQRIDDSVKRILITKEKYGFLEYRKSRDISEALSLIRNKQEIEDLVCRNTIVLLRNRLKKIPLQTDQKIGIIEWDKTRSTVQLDEPTHSSYLEKFARKYFKEVKVLLLPLKRSDITVIKEFIDECDNILVGPFSRTPELEMIQANMIREILKLKNDAIVIATGNPYDIRQFPKVSTYVVTFGFRNSQMRALFDVLTGKFNPCGKLPVEIEGVFPRWYSNSNHSLK